jgi:hypothetical protein
MFDLFAGAIIPIVLLTFDPIVFRSYDTCFPTLGYANISAFAYTAIMLGIVVLIDWLFVGVLRRIASSLAAGVFLVGGFFGAGLGIAMLPISIPVMIVLIGALGLFPFVTAFVYFRNAWRAYYAARERTQKRRFVWAGMVVGIFLILAISTLAQVMSSVNVGQVATSIRNCSSE